MRKECQAASLAVSIFPLSLPRVEEGGVGELIPSVVGILSRRKQISRRKRGRK